MLKKLTLFACFLVSTFSYGQTVYWGNKVLEVSSEFTQYSSREAIGKPDVPSSGGENPHSWSPRRTDNIESIKIGFKNPMRIQQVVVHETFNPGAAYQVFTYDQDDNEYLG